MFTVMHDQSIHSVVLYMREKRVGGVVVVEAGRLAGIFTERDLLMRVVAEQRDLRQTQVSEVMTRRLVTAHPDESYRSCWRKMKKLGCRHLPVVVEERLLGLISMRDLQEEELREKTEEIEMMTGYIYSVTSGTQIH